MRSYNFILLLLALALCAPACAPRKQNHPSSPAVLWPGAQPDGSTLLPNQWSLRPVGRQVELGDFPVNIAVHPGGRFVAILHSGHSDHEILIVDILAGSVFSRTQLP